MKNVEKRLTDRLTAWLVNAEKSEMMDAGRRIAAQVLEHRDCDVDSSSSLPQLDAGTVDDHHGCITRWCGRQRRAAAVEQRRCTDSQAVSLSSALLTARLHATFR